VKITLNLATRPYADAGPALKRLRIGMGVLAGLLILLGLGMLHFHQAALVMAAREATVDQSIDRVEREQHGYQAQMQQPANAKVLTQAEFLNQLFDEKSFSWTAAMEDLERVLPAGVQVTAIEPARGKDGRLTLRLRISGQRERSVEMVRNMERSRRFADPRVSGENAESGNAQGNLQQVRESGKVTFDILAEYNPATLEERKAEIAGQKHPHPGADGRSAALVPGARQPYTPPNPQANRQPAAPRIHHSPQSHHHRPGKGPVRIQSRMPNQNPGQTPVPAQENPQ
jgi:type IV pilus assembly protein PilN